MQNKGKIALVGNPNVGKSVIFGALTGRYAFVSNYPGTTVEVSRGHAFFSSVEYEIIDTPGVNSILPASEDERVTRDILLNERPDYVVHVCDAKNLRRALIITLELAELGLKTSLAINMYDEAGERGISIDVKKLAAALSIEVVPTIATQKWGLDKLKGAATGGHAPTLRVSYPPPVEAAIQEIEKVLPESLAGRRGVAVMLASGDRTLEAWLVSIGCEQVIAKVYDERAKLSKRYSEPVAFIVNKSRLRAVDALLEDVITVDKPLSGAFYERAGRLAMHPVWGFFILAAVLFVMYEFVGVFGAGVCVDFLQKVVFGKYLIPWLSRLLNAVLGSGFLFDFLIGPYGLLSMAMTYAIAIVLPIVGFFFIFFSILEDSGYLPRLAVMVDKGFKRMGLNGKAVLPMVLGLGCATMATMTTRILETKKERIIVTLLLALGIPCSAQLGVILAMLSAVSMKAALVWLVCVVLVIFLVSYLASKIIKGEASDFILEIPPMRMPQLSNIVLKTFVRVEWYLKEAVPLFILGTLCLFVSDKTGLLLLVQRGAEPVFKGLLDLPVEATASFVMGFLRRDYGAAGLFELQSGGMLDAVQTVVALVTMTLFVPCIANFFVIIKERGLKAAFYMAVFIFPFAVAVGAILNLLLRGLAIKL